jgi:hypothetical protein
VQGQPLVECHAATNIFEGQSGSSNTAALREIRSSNTIGLPVIIGCITCISAVMDSHSRRFWRAHAFFLAASLVHVSEVNLPVGMSSSFEDTLELRCKPIRRLSLSTEPQQ